MEDRKCGRWRSGQERLSGEAAVAEGDVDGEVGRLEAGVVGMIVVGFTTYAIDGGICAPVRCNRECAVGDGG